MGRTATIMFCAVLVLVTVGFVTLASIGVVHDEVHGAPLLLARRQALWIVLAAVTGVLAALIPYRVWQRLAVPAALFSMSLLAAVLVGGARIQGSARWLQLGPLRFQPSELAKISVVMLLAWWLARVKRHAREWVPGTLIPLVMLSGFLLLIFIAPDFGTTFLLGVVGLGMLFLAGAHAGSLLIVSIAGGTMFLFAVMHNELRMQRFLAFLEPEKYAQREAFQLLNALYAFVLGGLRGVGLGQSLQKRFYLPEAHNDFIFAIVGEELGALGTFSVLLMYTVLLVCGMAIARHARDPFGRLLAAGLTIMLVAQAVINMAVTTGCLPTKGIVLPFISAGGSSMVVSAVMIGMLINVALCPGADTTRHERVASL